MKLTRYFAAGAAILAAGSIAWGAGLFSTLPIVGQPSFCGSTVSGVGSTAAPWLITPSNTQGTTQGICAQTIPAGPQFLTGNELIPADTSLAGSAAPQTVTIPSGMLGGTFGSNVLVGPDFGQNLWQRGTTPINATTPTSATYGPDGWYAITNGTGAATTVTVSKQTAAADTFSGTLASARIQRPSLATGTNVISFGQLVPDDSSQRFFGNNAIFSCFLQSGANFSPSGGNIQMVIAYHSAADVTTGAANGQGTNTATFATSVTGTQNITNYTEAVNTTLPVTSAYARYSVAAAIPTTIPGTATLTTGVGVKINFTPVGTAGANDWLEVANCQLESRAGSSVGPSNFNRRALSDEYQIETARYWAILENGNANTPIYANGLVGATNQINLAVMFPTLMRITPITSPITMGGFKLLIAGTATTPGTFNTTGTMNTPRTGALSSQTAATAGQATEWIGSGAGTGVLGWSAEP